MKKYINYLAFAMMAVFSLTLASCSDSDKDDEGEKGGTNNGKGNSSSYNVKLPSGTTGVTIEALSDAEVSKLQSQGYAVVGTPVNVTQNGSDHVVLNDLAAVSFKIPKDFPKEDYGELVGVLMTDEGPEYIIPDLAGLTEGIVRFKTIHFCEVLAVKDKEKLNDKFAEYVAVHGWNNDLRESDFNKLGDQLKDIANKAGFGENDLLGITVREVLGSNDYVNKTMEYVKHYDNGNFTDNAIGEISEKLADDIQKKALSILFTKLKQEPDNKAVKECLEKYLTKENMEKAGTLLGSESPADVALQFAKDFAVDKMKSFATQNPYVKAFVVAAEVEVKAIDIFHKFWARNDMIYYYNEYKKDPRNWDDWIAAKIGTPKFEFNMTLEEIGEMFKKRYNDEKKINAKKAEVLKLINLWENEDLLTRSSPSSKIDDYFTNNGKQNDDYCMRLTRIHKLMERFRKELVVDGGIWHDGTKWSGTNVINEYLSDIVWHYITFYPDEEAFYKWLAKEGYINKKLEKNVDNLDGYRSWRLVNTEGIPHENTKGDRGQYLNYSASGTELRKEGKVLGAVGPYRDDYKLFDLCFVVTIQEPPTTLNAGDTLRMHITAKRTTDATIDKEYNNVAYFDYTDVIMWWNMANSSGYFGVENLEGPKGGPSSYSTTTTSTWDFVKRVPSGSKGKEESVILQGCGSKVIWTYRWCGPFD